MTTWMVVEDEPDLYDMVLAMYATMGVDGTSFVTGEEAIDWIEEVDDGHYHGELPELALLDIRLPGAINGVKVSERMRESPHLKDIAIVLMTAYRLNPSEEKDVINQAGSDLLIYKPLPKLGELHTMLLDLVNKRQNNPSTV